MTGGIPPATSGPARRAPGRRRAFSLLLGCVLAWGACPPPGTAAPPSFQGADADVVPDEGSDLAPAAALELRAALVRAAKSGSLDAGAFDRLTATLPSAARGSLEADRDLFEEASRLPALLGSRLVAGSRAPAALGTNGEIVSSGAEGFVTRDGRGGTTSVRFKDHSSAALARALLLDAKEREPESLLAVAAGAILGGDLETAQRAIRMVRARADASAEARRLAGEFDVLSAAYEAAFAEAEAAERLERWFAAGEAADPFAMEEALREPRFARAAAVARSADALRGSLEKRFAAAFARPDGVARLFRGKTAVQPDGSVEIRYDFEDPEQIADFEVGPYPVLEQLWAGVGDADEKVEPFRIVKGRLSGGEMPSLRHRAEFAGDGSMEFHVAVGEAATRGSTRKPVLLLAGMADGANGHFVASVHLQGLWQTDRGEDRRLRVEGGKALLPGAKARLRLERARGRVRTMRDGSVTAEDDDVGPARGAFYLWAKGRADFHFDDLVLRGRLDPDWLRAEATRQASERAAAAAAAGATSGPDTAKANGRNGPRS